MSSGHVEGLCVGAQSCRTAQGTAPRRTITPPHCPIPGSSPGTCAGLREVRPANRKPRAGLGAEGGLSSHIPNLRPSPAFTSAFASLPALSVLSHPAAAVALYGFVVLACARVLLGYTFQLVRLCSSPVELGEAAPFGSPKRGSRRGRAGSAGSDGRASACRVGRWGRASPPAGCPFLAQGGPLAGFRRRARGRWQGAVRRGRVRQTRGSLRNGHYEVLACHKFPFGLLKRQSVDRQFNIQ